MIKTPNNNGRFSPEGGGYEPEIEQSISPVGTLPGKNILVIAAIIIFGGGLLYYTFFSGDKTDEKTPKIEEVAALPKNVQPAKPASAETDNPIPAIPVLPDPPALVAPTPPTPITPTVPSPSVTPLTPSTPPSGGPVLSTPTPPPFDPTKGGASANESREARLKSSIVLGGAGDGKGGDKKDVVQTDPRRQFFTPEKTDAQQSRATVIGDPMATVAQGKIIDAVLETAINTDLTGKLRAIVSRDVYAEAGDKVMVPKGSRLIGDYIADIKRGQKRVVVEWKRIIRPDGIDIKVDSPGVDQLGRAGVEGLVDNRYFEVLANAVLLSTVTVAWTKVAENIVGSSSTTTTSTTNTNGSVTTAKSGKASDFAIQDASNDIGDAAKQIATDSLEVKPTITVDQGTRIKVFVNRDLVFPATAGRNIQVIQ